ncbi:MAG: c-type cytochrome [Rudaea sp.]|nr:c-type cytochrome [Rudaea sp.]
MKIVRGIAKVLVALLAAAGIALGFVYWHTGRIFAERIVVAEPALPIPADAPALSHGAHVALTHGCADCHDADLGGKVIVDAFPIGRIAGPNLTRGKGGIGRVFDARSAELAIRHGLGPDGRPLLFMPSHDYSGLSDADTADLIAYIAARPPVDREVPPPLAGPLARVLFLLDRMPLIEALQIDQHAAHRSDIEAAPTVEYGAYLAMSACGGCHGEHFSGGRVPGTPPSFPAAQNLTPDPVTGIGKWSKADFHTALRQGRRPDGSTLDPFMPWPALAQMTDLELDALWAYLQTLPPRPQGQR